MADIIQLIKRDSVEQVSTKNSVKRESIISLFMQLIFHSLTNRIKIKQMPGTVVQLLFILKKAICGESMSWPGTGRN